MRGVLAAAVCASVLLAACGGDSPEALVAAGKQSLEKKDAKTAIIQFKNALQKKSDLGEARYLLGRALLESGDVSAAAVELEKARELRYKVDLVMPQLLRAKFALGRYQQVIDEGQAATLIGNEAKASVSAVMAASHLALGKVADARSAAEAALAADPKNVPAQLMQARILLANNDKAGALKRVDEVLAGAPEDLESMLFRASLLEAAGKGEEAIAQYRRALQQRGDLIGAHARVLFLLMDLGKTEDAKAQLEAMAKVAPNHPSTLSGRALFTYSSGDYKAAREVCQQLLKVAPGSAFALQLAGATEHRLGSYVQAREYLQKSVQIASAELINRRWLASTELRMGNPSRALAALQPVATRMDNDSASLALLGEIQMHLGDSKKALEAFAKAQKLSPKDAGIGTSAALARFAQGDQEQALAELEKMSAEDRGAIADRALVAAAVERRDFARALGALERLEKKFPNDPTVFQLRGRVLLAKGDAAGAKQAFERALAVSPGYLAAATSLAEIDQAEKRPDAAQKRLDAVVSANPKNPEGYLALAALKKRLDAPADEVIALIRKAIDAAPAEPGPRSALVGFYAGAGQQKKAVEVAQEAVAAVGEKPELLEVLGRAQQAAGNSNQALATYAKLAAATPNSIEPYLRMAEIHASAGDAEAAARSLRKALEIRPDAVAAQRGLIAFELARGRPADAMAIAKEIQKQRPRDTAGYLLEGAIGTDRKAWGQASEAYRAGLKQNPGSTELALRLFASLEGAGKKADAERFAAEWIKENPRDVGFRFGMGDRARQMGDYEAAVKHYQAALEITPESPALLNNLAWAAGKVKDPKAVSYAEKANKIAPEQPAIMDTLAMLLADAGDTGRALDLLARAVKLDAGQPDIRLNYARVLLKAGKKKEAGAELQELAKLGSKFGQQAEVTRLLKEI